MAKVLTRTTVELGRREAYSVLRDAFPSLIDPSRAYEDVERMGDSANLGALLIAYSEEFRVDRHDAPAVGLRLRITRKLKKIAPPMDWINAFVALAIAALFIYAEYVE